MNFERRLKGLERQVVEIRRAVRSARRTAIPDDEIVAGFESGGFDSRHLDAAYEVLRPGVLGSVLIGASNILRLSLQERDRRPPRPASGFDVARWVIAAGQGSDPGDFDVDQWTRSMTTPPGDERPRGRWLTQGDFALAAQLGLANRLVLEYGLEWLKVQAARLAGRSTDEQGRRILIEVIPAVDQAQWERMLAVFRPLEIIWDEKLTVPTPEGEIWISGPRWT